MADTLTSDNELTWASFPIEKVEQTADGNVTVWGKATDDSLDSDQQIIDPDFAAKAMAEFFESGPNIRVQHQANRDPAGVGISYEKDGSAHWMKSRIIEPVAKQLVLGGALRAYSVGIARPTIQRDATARGGRITDGMFVEISLVDRPANKNCGIQLVKRASDGSVDITTKVFGSPVLEKSDDVTLTLPSDVQVGFSPADLAKIVSRRNGNGFVAKAATLDDVVVLPPASRLDKGKKKKALRAAAAAAGVTGDDDKSATAMTSPNTIPAASVKADEADEAVSAALDAAQHAQALDTDEEKAGAAPANMQAPAASMKSEDLDQIARAEEAMLAIIKMQGTDEDVTFLGKASRTFTAEQRREHASSGTALPDGSYPMPDADAVRRAAILIRSKHGNWKAAARLLARRVRALGIPNPLKKKPKAEKAGAAVNPGQSAPASMKKEKAVCPECGAIQNQQHKFCAECGKAMMGAPEIAKNHDFICTQCGYELDKGEKFCPSCGKPNPGHNPMADLKIPANKADGSRVADDVTQAVTDQDGEQVVVKAKKPPKKGKKGKPFGGNQAKPFGKSDDDADDADSKKGADAALTAPSMTSKGKNKPPKKVTDGTTPGAASGAVARGDEDSQPSPRSDQVGFEFDRDASKSAEAEIGTQMRLKGLGMDTVTGYAHDLVCAAYSWDDVAKSYPSGMSLLDANEWQQKALQAAANAPLDEATAASRIGQAVFTLKSANVQDVIDIKGDLYKAFKDANPGPGSFPTPGEVCASHFQRPNITAGRASYGAHYGSPNSAPVPPEGGMSAAHFHRDNIRGETTNSPANMSTKGRAPVPDPPGVVMNLDYSSIMKEQIVAAMDAMHTHFDRIFPGVCPMNSSYGRAAHPVQAAKADEATEIEKKVSPDGMSKKQRAKRDAKLTRKVMKGKMPLDQARIKMGKKPVVAPEPLKPLKGQSAPEIAKAVSAELQSGPAVITKKDLRAALVKSRKSTDKQLRTMASVISALADQPDPGTQPWKGIAMNPMRTKSAAPAAVQSVAEAAERSQMMVMHQLEQTARNSTNPSEREAAQQQVWKMKGIIS